MGSKLAATCVRALVQTELREKQLQRAALKAKPARWKTVLGEKLPPMAFAGLESAFYKGFSLVFQKGTDILEKGYDKAALQADFAIRDFALQVKGGRKEWKQVDRGAKKVSLRNMTVTALEGIGLGALGIGLPDIVLFLANLLTGIYETALSYGFDYSSPYEQLLILQLMETSLSCGEAWKQNNAQINAMLTAEPAPVTEAAFDAQLRATSAAFAMDMLLLKFIQGIPVVGIIGGAANPVYYRKVMRYAELKYRKRYLLQLLGCTSQTGG